MTKKILFVLLILVVVLITMRVITRRQSLRSAALPFIEKITSESTQAAVKQLTPGDYSFSMQFQKKERTYLVHIPSSYSPSRTYPLVFALHGGGGEGSDIIRLTKGGFSALADKAGFIIAYPSAYDKNWNDGRGVLRYASQKENIDDVSFISALIDEISKRANVDKKRVYVTGISNGALMTERLACELSNRITAVAPVAGGLAKNLATSCKPSRPVPILMINGTADPLVPWNSEDVLFFGVKYGKKLTIPDTIQFWITKNKAEKKPASTTKINTDSKDGVSIIKTVYQGSQKTPLVVMYAVQGGGHTWPGGIQYLSKKLVGATSNDISAEKTMWDFFKNYSLP